VLYLLQVEGTYFENTFSLYVDKVVCSFKLTLSRQLLIILI
jgi:hypothetical protein